MTNDIDYGRLGERIKRYRRKAHWTQEQLAGRIDVATSTIAHAESGTSKPSLPLLIKIANELNVSLDQLISDSLPIADVYIQKDISDILADCTITEKQIIRDILLTTKETFLFCYTVSLTQFCSLLRIRTQYITQPLTKNEGSACCGKPLKNPQHIDFTGFFLSRNTS